jgi:hypothetical protein
MLLSYRIGAGPHLRGRHGFLCASQIHTNMTEPHAKKYFHIGGIKFHVGKSSTSRGLKD